MRVAPFIVPLFAIAACSLAVSESDYVGGRPADGGVTTTDGPTGSEAGDADGGDAATATDASDTGTDAGPDPSLVGHWTFETIVGGMTVKDASGKGNDGRLGGGASVQASDFAGAALILGVGNIDAMYVDSLQASEFPRTGTLSIHFKYDFGGDSTNRGVFSNFAANDHLFLRRGNAAGADEFQVAYQRASTSFAFEKTFTLSRNVWAHVVMTWNEGTMNGKLYVNKVLSKVSAYDAAWTPTQQVFRIGDNFIGAVDEIRLYDVEKPFSEIELIP